MALFTPAPSPKFPAAWSWLVDDAIPQWVKDCYSPKESWKGKPFSNEDARFFFRGIDELSSLFTEDRARGDRPGVPTYFRHPKFRSAYLLYFLPLQAAKFLALFEMHPRAIEAALLHAKTTGVLRVADLGAGPGTASLALLVWLIGHASEFEKKTGSLGKIGLPPKIALEWHDLDRAVMVDGKALVERLIERNELLRGKVEVTLHAAPWTQAASPNAPETSLIFMGHVLNEDIARKASAPALWSSLLKRARGGGILIVEPASKGTSQRLSQLRDALLGEELIPAQATSIWGPCLHAGHCPLAEGKDWCHFSIPAEIPGKWFKTFSRSLGSERQWVKFSYLWLSAEGARAPEPRPELRRVVSDPMRSRGASRTATVLLSEPERAGRLEVPAHWKIHRGDLVTLTEDSRKPRQPRPERFRKDRRR